MEFVMVLLSISSPFTSLANVDEKTVSALTHPPFSSHIAQIADLRLCSFYTSGTTAVFTGMRFILCRPAVIISDGLHLCLESHQEHLKY